MRLSDWSSDVCSSDLFRQRLQRAGGADRPHPPQAEGGPDPHRARPRLPSRRRAQRMSDDATPRRPGTSLSVRLVAAALVWMLLLLGAGGVVLSTAFRSEEHTSELQSLMRISYAVFCLKKIKNTLTNTKLVSVH